MASILPCMARPVRQTGVLPQDGGSTPAEKHYLRLSFPDTLGDAPATLTEACPNSGQCSRHQAPRARKPRAWGRDHTSTLVSLWQNHPSVCHQVSLWHLWVFCGPDHRHLTVTLGWPQPQEPGLEGPFTAGYLAQSGCLMNIYWMISS